MNTLVVEARPQLDPGSWTDADISAIVEEFLRAQFDPGDAARAQLDPGYKVTAQFDPGEQIDTDEQIDPGSQIDPGLRVWAQLDPSE